MASERYRPAFVLQVLPLVLVAVVGAAQGQSRGDAGGPAATAAQASQSAESTQASVSDDFEVDPNWQIGHYARIETSFGRVVARLLPEQAPQSAAHFAAMAEGKLAWTDPINGEELQFHYYDGIQIHNVRAGLLFEAGDWTGTGKGAPPLYVPQEGLGPVNFTAGGRLGMARPHRRNSAVQFFATASGNSRLNGSFPCFGIIVEGTDVIWNLSQTKATRTGHPLDPPTIETIRIFTVGNPLPLPEPRQIAQPRLSRPELRDDIYERLEEEKREREKRDRQQEPPEKG